ncbi:SDR family oxidoreductase [Ferrimonas aestuarii]|uniref:SDR family oxidoreductase n=1 Tax=Ferrimonas aestuarii TaxID=2569539 RepID=A0A4U1BLM1_9GAMM|nr:SDR family oxidoreductase [Ferrimonas aestuarii]TKB53690.1 SDR family oxidoreductase [Ferrimonas aestuarii]
MSGLQGKVVLLTGASEGIGRELAKQLVASGANLMMAARNLERLYQLYGEMDGGEQVRVCGCDVSDQQQCQNLVAMTLKEFGCIDVVINNAGITMWSRFDDTQDLSIFENLMRVNYLGAVYLTHAALPCLKTAKGQVVAIASVAGLTGVPSRTGYAASKHAMIGFFDSLRIELKQDGVDVTVICPDFVVSEIHKRAIGADGQPLGDSPMQEAKIMTAEQCARLSIEAIAKRQRLLVTSLRGRLGRWFKLLAPRFIDHLADKAIRDRH